MAITVADIKLIAKGKDAEQWSKRVGMFTIKDKEIKTNPELCLSVFSNVVVVRAEYMFAYGGIEYTGISDLFEQLIEGDAVPNYELIFENNLFVKAKKVEL